MLGLTPSAVSKLISRLETRLHVSLFVRSTRGLTLTDEGLAYREHGERLVSGLRRLEETLGDRRRSPEGRLVIAAPRELAEHHVADALAEFVGAHPRIEIELVISAGAIFPMEPRPDVEIRVGSVHDETLCIRKLGTTTSVVVAAPSYLRARGEPRRPADLAQHDCLCHAPGRGLDAWTFVVDGRLWRHVARGNVQSDDLEALRRMALAGMGIACLPDFMTDRDVMSGRLSLLLLPFASGLEEPVSAVFAADAHRPYRVRAFVELLVGRAVGAALTGARRAPRPPCEGPPSSPPQSAPR